MAGYAVAHLRKVDMGPAIVEYLQRIDATLEPYGGHFLVHGAWPEVREGEWVGGVVIVEFPDLGRARAWYESAAYQEILPLRADNSSGALFLIDGVKTPHKATDILG